MFERLYVKIESEIRLIALYRLYADQEPSFYAVFLAVDIPDAFGADANGRVVTASTPSGPIAYRLPRPETPDGADVAPTLREKAFLLTSHGLAGVRKKSYRTSFT